MRTPTELTLAFRSRGLKVTPQRAAQGGAEIVRGVEGRALRVPVPTRAARGTVIRIPGEGLPRARGGRGDLLVRILYRPAARVVGRPWGGAAG